MNTRIRKIRPALLATALLSSVLLTSCGDDLDRVHYPHSTPDIVSLQVTPTQGVTAGDSLYVSASLKDEATPLSTMDIRVVSSTYNISQIIRTTGNDFTLDRHAISMPFVANLQPDEVAHVTITVTNVEGDVSKDSVDVPIHRPEIPSTLWVVTGTNAIALHQSEDNPYEYVSEEGVYDNQFSGKIATTADLSGDGLLFGGSEDGDNNTTVPVTGQDAPNFTFSFPTLLVTKIIFNTLSFQLDAEGTSDSYLVNGVQLKPDGNLYTAEVNFTQGEEVTLNGFSDVEHAWNRDFFSHDTDAGTFTFLRQSGTWKVSYSKDFNYLWISRDDDVAPDCFWMIGHGFTCSPVWNDFYTNADGWNMEDITQEAYVVKTGDHQYQCTVYLNNHHKWDSFEAEFYSNKEWGKDEGMLITQGNMSGDITGIVQSNSNGITSGDGFVPGYYRLIFDTSAGVGNEKLNIQRIGD